MSNPVVVKTQELPKAFLEAHHITSISIVKHMLQV